jgi:predicted ATPase
MFLKKLQIHNYKSLRNVCFHPSPLAVLVGPNASGKSNFASAVHFLSEVYSQGLEIAIARKGGYENIAFRKQRRSRVPVEFEITLEASGRELKGSFLLARHEGMSKRHLRLVHSFSVVAVGSGVKTAFKVGEETFSVLSSPENSQNASDFLEVARVTRVSQNKIEWYIDKKNFLVEEVRLYESLYKEFHRRGLFSKQELLMGRSLNFLPFSSAFLSAVSNFDVYQFSTVLARTSGVPTPNPKLSSAGENLPALIDWLQRTHLKEWKLVLSGMRDVLPGLKDISIEYLHTKTLGIFFKEEGVGHSWTADEVSDGTMQALALLTAAADPRTSLLLVEEPENSVHPWILRVIMERLREVSKRKNVIVTSHSPVLINLMKPEEVWVVFRKDGESHLQRLLDFDPSLEESWERGGFQLSEFLDSGSISQAVPGGVF